MTDSFPNVIPGPPDDVVVDSNLQDAQRAEKFLIFAMWTDADGSGQSRLYRKGVAAQEFSTVLAEFRKHLSAVAMPVRKDTNGEAQT